MFKYFYRLRPPGPGCQPRGFIEVKEEDINQGQHYWGWVTYDRELSPAEIDNYDLENESKDLFIIKIINVILISR